MPGQYKIFDNVWKGQRFLKLSGDSLEKFEGILRNTDENSSIQYRIINVEYDKVTIEVRQRKFKLSDIKEEQRRNNLPKPREIVYFTQERLIENTRKVFEKYFEGKELHINAIAYENPTLNINVSILKLKIKELNLKPVDIARETGIEYTHLSALISGKRPLSQTMKALFYYYFEVKTMNFKRRKGITVKKGLR